MPLYAVRQWRGEPVAREHDAMAWALPTELDQYEMPPADEPLVAALKALAQ
jgi:8-oxo-dGTP diphosphatase